MIPEGLPSSKDVVNGLWTEPNQSDMRRIVSTDDEKLVVRITTESTAPKNISPKIGSGRLCRVEGHNARNLGQGQGRKRNSRQRHADVWKQREPVMIGMAVIQTPGEDIDQSSIVRKGILKPSKEPSYEEPAEDEELVVDWNKEVAKAVRRKALEERIDDDAQITQSENVEKMTSAIKEVSLTLQSKNECEQEEQNVAGNDDDEWEDVDEDEFHDASFDEFIKENTLKLEIECPVPPGWSSQPQTPGSQSDSSYMKTPTGHVQVLDWGAEMDAVLADDVTKGDN